MIRALHTPATMTFPEFLRAQIDRLGDGVAQRGEAIVALIWGTSPRTIRRIASGEARANLAEQTGARILLPQAAPLSERDKRLRRRKAPAAQAPQ